MSGKHKSILTAGKTAKEINMKLAKAKEKK
jgi:hypothetical protein